MKIGLFIRNGVVGNITLNKLLSDLIEMGYQPVFFNTGEGYNAKADHDALNYVDHCETSLLRDVVSPFMKNYENKGTYLTVEDLAEKYQIDLMDVPDVNSSDFRNMIIDDPDIVGGLCMRITQIFKSETIEIFKEKGFLWNLHTGLLPKYKGVFIPYHSIENNESHYGWTLHEIDKGIDTGGILSMDQNLLDPKKPILDTYLDMADKGVAMIMGALMFYSKHKRSPVPVSQKTDHESYFTFPTEIEMRRWNSQGIRFSDDIVQTYLNLYTIPNTPERSALKNKLEKAISEFEHQEFQGITITKGQLAA